MKKILFSIACLVLIGCDSGSSSSGSSVNVTETNNSSPEQIGEQYAGTYTGTLEGTYTATALGISDSDSTPITIVIREDGSTTVTAEGRSYEGTLDTDRLTAVIDVNESIEGISCTGRVNVDARLSGDTISGTANGSGNCSQDDFSTPVEVRGTLNASR